MNCKKILIVTSEFPPQPGGIGNHAYNLGLELSKTGFLVTVLCDNRSTNDKEEVVFDEALPFEIVRNKRYSFIWLSYFRRIVKYLKLRNKNTKVIASGKFSLWLVGLDLLLPKEVKYAIIHGSEVNLQGLAKKITNTSLLRFNKIIAVSNYTKSLIAGLKLNNCFVIPNGFRVLNGVNPSVLEKQKKRNSFPTLITVGNVTERKGQLNIIKALPELIKLHSDIHYHMVGIPTEQKTYEAIAIDLGVEKHVTFHGKVSEDLKLELLQQSDIFVMLSNVTSNGDVEGFGIAILEANSIGIPAIGANTSGIVDAIKKGYSGELIDPMDSKAFLNGISTILKNQEDYNKQAQAWSENFSWSKIIKKYMDVIT